MADAWFSCKGCIGSDRTQDTVKVDPNMLTQGHRNKENVEPLRPGSAQMDAIAQKQEAEEQRRAKAAKEAERQKAEAAAAAAAEEERLRQEARKAAAEEAQRQAEERMRQEVEERARQEEAAAAAAAVKAAEEEHRRQAARQAAEEREKEARRAQEQAARELTEAREKVSDWCKINGYEEINTHKKTMRGARKFALHTAVKHKNDEMVRLLLKCGADQSKVDSKNNTPYQLAEKLNSNGSHFAIMAMFH